MGEVEREPLRQLDLPRSLVTVRPLLLTVSPPAHYPTPPPPTASASMR